MDVPDWESLARIVKMGREGGKADWSSLLLGWAVALIPKYQEIWLALSEPSDREEWHTRLYGRGYG